MKNNMQFSVDKENKKINVQREFAAPVSKVWDAWTKPEWLDKWWAPKPWKAETVSMDFSVGGRWLYYMQGPEGERHYSIADYKAIDSGKSYSALDGFTDEKGNILPDFPRSMWHNTFSASDGNTHVNIDISFDKLDDLEKMIEMGFKEGFAMAMENLDEIFAR
jgi:uncharacterized protein YndB with AHSA1/START domain